MRQGGVELHLAARVPARSGPESGERPLDAAAALLQQRQMHPQGTAAAVSATPIDASPPGEKAQSSAARKLSIWRP